MGLRESAEALLFGRRDLRSEDLLGALARILDGHEFALQWMPGCSEQRGIELAWFELEGAGAWVFADDVRRARKLAMRVSEVLSRPLDYVETKLVKDGGVGGYDAHVESWECVGRRLLSPGRRDTQPHDGNTVLIALEGADLNGIRAIRGTGMHLYPVTSIGNSDPPDDSDRAITELRPNLRELWEHLKSGTGYLRRAGPKKYILEILDVFDIERRSSVGSLTRSVDLTAAEVRYISSEIQRQQLPPLNVPALEGSYWNEVLRWIAYSSGR